MEDKRREKKRRGGDCSPPVCYCYPKICKPGVPTFSPISSRQAGQAAGAGMLERQPQAERHDARACSDKELCLAKRAAGQVGINSIEVGMISEVLGLRAKT